MSAAYLLSTIAPMLVAIFVNGFLEPHGMGVGMRALMLGGGTAVVCAILRAATGMNKMPTRKLPEALVAPLIGALVALVVVASSFIR